MTGRLLDRLGALGHSERFHLAMMGVWGVLVVPTILLWSDSILWVAFMSLYANFVGHFSAFDACRAERRAKQTEDLIHKTDH